MPLRKTALSLIFLLADPLLGLAQNTLSLDDVGKIRIVHKKYEEAWLKGDPDAVRALFTDDSVLLPPHAGKPWWPERIERFLVSAERSAHQNNQAGCRSAEYRWRRPSRLHLGHP